jgi:hypothetical protein
LSALVVVLVAADGGQGVPGVTPDPDAAESVVNLVAAVVALRALRWASKPVDEEHAYGHQKAEYFPPASRAP